LSTSFAFAQNSNAELDSLIVKGIANNKGLKASQLQVDKYEANIKVLIHLKNKYLLLMKIIFPNKQLNVLGHNSGSFQQFMELRKKFTKRSMKRKASYEKKAICH
jgi:cobalt-zinc-cadmium resistance protein CzcA